MVGQQAQADREERGTTDSRARHLQPHAVLDDKLGTLGSLQQRFVHATHERHQHVRMRQVLRHRRTCARHHHHARIARQLLLGLWHGRKGCR